MAKPPYKERELSDRTLLVFKRPKGEDMTLFAAGGVIIGIAWTLSAASMPGANLVSPLALLASSLFWLVNSATLRTIIEVTPHSVVTYTTRAGLRLRRLRLVATPEVRQMYIRHKGTAGGRPIEPDRDPALFGFVTCNEELVECQLGFPLSAVGPCAVRIAELCAKHSGLEHEIPVYISSEVGAQTQEFFEPSRKSRVRFNEEDDRLVIQVGGRTTTEVFGSGVLILPALFLLCFVIAALAITAPAHAHHVNKPLVTGVSLAVAALLALGWAILVRQARKPATIDATSERIQIEEPQGFKKNRVALGVESLAAIQAAPPQTGDGLELRFIFADAAQYGCFAWAREEDLVLAAIGLRQALSIPDVPQIATRRAPMPEPSLN